MAKPANEVVNFGRNLSFCPRVCHVPRDEDEVLGILAEHRGQKIRAIGRLHSWSEAPRAEEVLIDLRHLNQVRVEYQGDGIWATVGAGCQIKQLLGELERQAKATLPSLGLITQQTIAGAISTGTHGSGRHSMSHYVAEVRLATYDPQTGQPVIRTINAGLELRAARCSLGCLGIIVSVKLHCRTQYVVEEHVREYATLGDVLAAQEHIPLQQFYLIPWLWLFLAQNRREVDAPRSLLAPLYRAYWFLFIDVGLHLVLQFLVKFLRSAGAVRFFYRRIFPRMTIRDWKVVDQSHAMLVMKHELFCHIEIEVFVRETCLSDAVRFVQEVVCCFGGQRDALSESTRQKLTEIEMLHTLLENCGHYTHHYPICIRRILSDDTLISMASSDDESYYALSLISYAQPNQRAGFFTFATFLAKSMTALFAARLHWGKVCPLAAEEVNRLYPHLEEFRNVCHDFDPAGVFRNHWIAELLSAGEIIRPTPVTQAACRYNPT